MDRRGFLGFIGVSGALILPELIGPRKTFFLPPRRGWGMDDTQLLKGMLSSSEAVLIPDGTYHIWETIHLRGEMYAGNLQLIAHEIPEDQPCIYVDKTAKGRINQLSIYDARPNVHGHFMRGDFRGVTIAGPEADA